MFIRAAIFSFVFAMLVGGVLSYYQKDHQFATTIEIKTEKTKKDAYVEEAEVKLVPGMSLKYEQSMSGKGRFIYATSYYFPVFITIKAPGYETKRFFAILKPNETHTYYIEKEEQKQVKKD